MSYTKVSNLAQKFHEVRKAWKATPLAPYYKVVYCDALYIRCASQLFQKEAVHIIYGPREDNKRELLALDVYPIENKETSSDCLTTLKNRGIKRIDVVVADGKGSDIHRLKGGLY